MSMFAEWTFLEKGKICILMVNFHWEISRTFLLLFRWTEVVPLVTGGTGVLLLVMGGTGVVFLIIWGIGVVLLVTRGTGVVFLVMGVFLVTWCDRDFWSFSGKEQPCPSPSLSPGGQCCMSSQPPGHTEQCVQPLAKPSSINMSSSWLESPHHFSLTQPPHQELVWDHLPLLTGCL